MASLMMLNNARENCKNKSFDAVVKMLTPKALASFPPALAVEAHCLLATALCEIGSKQEADAVFTTATTKLSGAPMPPQFLNRWGKLLFDQHRFPEAVERLEASAKAKPLADGMQGLLAEAKEKVRAAEKAGADAARAALGGGGGKKGKKGKAAAPLPPAGPATPPLPDLATTYASGACTCALRTVPGVPGLDAALKARDVRWQRFDIGRLLAQRKGWPECRKNDTFFLVPRAWWEAWCAHVGGFSEATDLAAWGTVQKLLAEGALPKEPDAEAVRRAFREHGLEGVLPEGAAGGGGSSCEGEAAEGDAGGGRGGGSSGSAAPSPGPMRSHSLLLEPPLAEGQQWADSCCHIGPRLRPGLTTADVFELPEDCWHCMRQWYQQEGPAVQRVAVAVEGGGGAEAAEKGAPLTVWYPEALPPVEGNAEGAGGGSSGEAPLGEGGGESAVTGAPAGSGSRFSSCRLCGTPPHSGTNLRNCSACKLVAYCDMACQLLDWENGHKQECLALAARKKAGESPEPPAPRRSMLVGLENIGNTCFMAASLQLLASVWPLTVFYVRGVYKEHLSPENVLGTKGAMSEEYSNMLKDLVLSNKKFVTPTAFLKQVRAFQSRFEGFSQHDAQELIMFIMDGLHEDCNKGACLNPKPMLRDRLPEESDLEWGRASWEWYCTVNQSQMVNLFMGQFRSELSCPTCSTRSVRFDAFNVINLPMPGSEFRTIDVLLRRMAPELLSAEAHEVPLPSASAEVRGTWDAIAEQGAMGELFALQVPANASSITVEKLLGLLAQKSHVDAQCLVITEDGRVLSPESQLSLLVDAEAPLVANQVAPASWLLPGGAIPMPEEDALVAALAVDCLGNDVPGGVGGPVTPQSPGWEQVVAGKKVGGGGGGGGPPPPPSVDAVAAPVDKAAALLRALPPSRRQLVLLELWVRTDKVAIDSVQQLGSAAHSWEPWKAFTQDKPQALLTITLSLPAGASAALLRMHAAAALLPLLGGLSAVRALLSSKVTSNHALHNPTKGANIPGHLVLLELANRLPLCAAIARAKPSKVSWVPVFALTGPTGAYTEAAEGPCEGVTMAALAPLECCGNKHGLALSAVGDGVATELAAQRFSVALRGHVLHGTLKRDSLPLRFPPALACAFASSQGSESSADIFNSFRRLLREEEMDESNMFMCGTCKVNVSGRKKMDVWRLPEYLVLNLKRYGTRLTKGGLRALKAEELVSFPLMGLDLSEFHSSAVEELGVEPGDPALKARSLYDCVGVVQQHGQMKEGHCEFFFFTFFFVCFERVSSNLLPTTIPQTRPT